MNLFIPILVIVQVITARAATHAVETLEDRSRGPFPPFNFPFWNASLSWEERLEDLVGRLTLDEVVLQLANGGTTPTPDIPRLGIGPFQWDTECLRGDACSQGNATAFPQAIGLAAAFSTALIYRVAEATSFEVRAKNNYFRRVKDYEAHTGVSCLSPVLNIARDPRWGRVQATRNNYFRRVSDYKAHTGVTCLSPVLNIAYWGGVQETYGEDPYLTGELAASFVWGLQGDHPRFVRASAGCKHFAVYSGPENIPVSRFNFSAQVSERDLRTTYLPAFRRCVEAGAFSIGGSYSAVNGVPSAANRKLLTDILYGEWGFQGYVSSDRGAVAGIQTGFHYTNNTVDTAAAAVKAGTTLELTNDTRFYLSLGDAVKQKKVSEALLRERIKPTFYTRLRLGEFDSPGSNPYRQVQMSQVESAKHRALAVEAAMKTFVLLKNAGPLLPLRKNRFNSIGVVGPLADSPRDLLGDYSANPDRSYISTPLDGLRPLADAVKYSSGCDNVSCASYNASAVKSAVSNNDVNFVVLGTGRGLEGEGHDRVSLELLGLQKQLLTDVMDTAGTTTPLVLLLIGGGPQNISFADRDPRVTAILQCFFPAQGAGDALRHVILNDVPFAVPAARLPYTWPMWESQIPPMMNYSMAGRTYRYLETQPLYPFGFGLSYTTFSYSQLSNPPMVHQWQDLTGSVVVTNTGKLDADEVVQVYVDWSSSPALGVPAPRKQLVWFDRVFITAGGSLTVDFRVKVSSMQLWYDSGHGHWDLKVNTWMNLYVGGQLPGQNKRLPSNILASVFRVLK